MNKKVAQSSALPPADANGSDNLLRNISRLARAKKLPEVEKFTELVIASGQSQSFNEFVASYSLDELAASKFCPDVEDDAPDWAKEARRMVFASLLPPRRKHTASEAYDLGFESGYVHSATELVSHELREEYGHFLSEMSKPAHDKLKSRAAVELPSDMAADFFCGLRDGEKLMRGLPERALQMAQRTKIYRAIAARWKEIAPGVLNSTGELHQWLLSQKVILPGTDSSEIRLVCAKIGLRYKKPGKPPKS